MKYILILLISASSLLGVTINQDILNSIVDVRFSKGTATASFVEDLPNITLIGRGNYVEFVTPISFDSNIVNEIDLNFSANRFNYLSSDILTIVGNYNLQDYNFNFIKWNEANPRLRLVSVSAIPEPQTYALIFCVFVGLIATRRKCFYHEDLR